MPDAYGEVKFMEPPLPWYPDWQTTVPNSKHVDEHENT